MQGKRVFGVLAAASAEAPPPPASAASRSGATRGCVRRRVPPPSAEGGTAEGDGVSAAPEDLGPRIFLRTQGQGLVFERIAPELAVPRLLSTPLATPETR